MASQLAAVTAVDVAPSGVHYQEVILTDGTTHVALFTTNAITSDWADVKGFSRHTLGVVNGASNSVIFTLEGSNDGTNFATGRSYRLLGSSVYVEAAVTLTAGSKGWYHLSPLDMFRFIRVNVSTSNAVGTTFTLYSET